MLRCALLYQVGLLALCFVWVKSKVFYGLEARWCQILGMCDQGTEALGKLFKDAEKDPYAYLG